MNIHYVTTHYNNNTLNGGSDFTPVLKLYMFKMSISIAIILKALTQLRYFFNVHVYLILHWYVAGFSSVHFPSHRGHWQTSDTKRSPQ